MYHATLRFKGNTLDTITFSDDPDNPITPPKKLMPRHAAMSYMTANGWIWRCSQEVGDRSELVDVSEYIKPSNVKDRLEIALMRHDWTYQMSDDYVTWEEGERQVQAIKALVANVGEEVARKMLETHLKKQTGVNPLEYYLPPRSEG